MVVDTATSIQCELTLGVPIMASSKIQITVPTEQFPKVSGATIEYQIGTVAGSTYTFGAKQ
jgi:hypothetical protein